MILIIPTDDGISISTDLKKAENFLILTTLNGLIEYEEIKKAGKGGIINLLEIIKGSRNYHDNGSFSLVVRSGNAEDSLPSNQGNLRILRTNDNNITNALIYFLREEATKESDYCCQP
jgi:hypothetical protein